MTSRSAAEELRATLSECFASDAPLMDRLARYAEAGRRARPDLAAAVEALIARLEASGAGRGAPAPGDRMPPFALPSRSGEIVSLDDLLDRGPAAIVFHRGHWCPYCRITAHALAEVQDRIASAGGQLVTITPETQQHANVLLAEAGARYPILSDPDNGYALSLNLAIWLGPEIARLYSGIGWNLPAFQGNEGWMLPIPAAFVVGQDGIVRDAFVDPDYRRRMEIERLVAAVTRRDGSAPARTGRPAEAG